MRPLHTLRTFVAAAALTAALPATSFAATTTIDFEGTSAPCCFVDTSPLSNAYAGLGVTFSGVGGTGGSILNQSGNFGFDAHSGTDFLAFNTGVNGISGVEDITFSTLQSAVSIWAANSNGGTIALTAYDVTGAEMATATISASAAWQQLSVSGVGIASVRLTPQIGVYAVDDLSFTGAVPEPEAYAMVFGGLAVLGLALRRRKTA
ncbi:MAG: PEP-CTERM sorting domain-containing protein [Aquabacterium sp.]|uniref:PEP-CTERM sorting domain-containing protein n=1 Tax=Aquabacterium sp. TaxID=1872578 RepID=UPI0025BDBF3C|nr:PEP-CTERM sorting domain-containing protein [Aquabacterium sp.]MBI5924840.1 PEP-CTERM sorting domain-containing protein [Aquabacterium sp.]